MKKILILTDIILLYSALALMILIRYPGSFLFHYGIHLVPFSIIFALWILTFYISNLYGDPLLRNNVAFYSALSSASLIAAALSVVFFYLIPLYGITPKTNLFIFSIIFSVLVAATRFFINDLRERKFKKLLILVGVNQQSIELAKLFKTSIAFAI